MRKLLLVTALLATSTTITACAPRQTPLAIHRGEDVVSYIIRNSAERFATAPIRYQKQEVHFPINRAFDERHRPLSQARCDYEKIDCNNIPLK